MKLKDLNEALELKAELEIWRQHYARLDDVIANSGGGLRLTLSPQRPDAYAIDIQSPAILKLARQHVSSMLTDIEAKLSSIGVDVTP